MSRTIRTILIAGSCLSIVAPAAVSVSACGARAVATGQAKPSVTPLPKGSVGVMPVRPHFQMLGNDRALATGWLRRVDLEGGFWALIAQPPGVTSGTPTVVAVLLPGRIALGRIATHDGAYLIVQGRLSKDASIRMSGPEIRVDSIRLLGMGQ